MDAGRDVVFQHAVERHLRVPGKTKQEVPAGEHNALRLDTDLMLLSLAEDRVVRAPVGGVPGKNLGTGSRASERSLSPQGLWQRACASPRFLEQ
jgi:hypothetical protein